MNPKEKAIKESLEVFDEKCKIHPTLVDDRIRAIIKVYTGISANIAIKERNKEVKEAIDKLAKSIDPYDWANQSGAWNKFLIELGLDK